MASNGRLISVLDDEDGGTRDERSEQGTVMVADETSSLAIYELELLKQRAEADALDKANRLRVAQEQLYEYAAQKEKDSLALLQQAEKVLAAVGDVSSSELLSQVQLLREKVAEAADEASSFAAQQKADVESLKRSSKQANLSGERDVEMKRARENGQVSADDDGQEWHDPILRPRSLSNKDAAMQEDAENFQEDLSAEDDDTSMGSAPSSTPPPPGNLSAPTSQKFSDRARYIPLRLNIDERRLLRLLEAALNVSEYTDKVDVLVYSGRNQRISVQIKDICAILSGLLLAQNYKRGQELVKDRNFKENDVFFQAVFEVGRRYKIMNPDKMRSEYGKLMYLLMDSSDPRIQDLLEFKCVQPLKTVYSLLEEKGGLKMLDDPLVEVATAEIHSAERPRYEVQRDIKAKEKAREALARRYRSSSLGEEDLLQCLYAIADNNSYLLFNRDPIDRMIAYFQHYFRPGSFEPGFSLAIQGGREGARLTHNHERQYSYVLQSLTLWREISTDMFRLWYLAESDMLRESNGYRLVDTGQGLNRIQAAPQVSKAMQQILGRCQSRIGSWVGSSVVHLGDHNVPNALHFIDKYTQVPRILNPVILVLDQIPKMARSDPEIDNYLTAAFGGVEQCRKTILIDFCRHAFDGSGADNFFDAGSCIDGRLTSAWNWCSKLEKKSYYPVFKLAGFSGFDGDFK
ncbi:hypothetical protein CEUSTIGMA_g5053.t1 [Chlamydomonas eustigma]|uniref:Non-canonical E2 ubiquitin-conjugating enzyme C-terminal domain-containing protein n=1 Tax=Chlamydomonas eustigma TaxID=1157962 RepID=A0A250X3W3_9CHLO|nr:hypothetical protein CEUSTIGMA_g5053.t1 [Chlamydomonas eustigma]|eukprot:GAX77609.1 hypothetical protein CEUSTIGMA_g5053.t1 [Chlamydomonas eustigma]